MLTLWINSRQQVSSPPVINGFYQPVKFVSREIVEKDSSAALIADGKTEALVLGDDAYFNTRIELAPEEISSPLVFVGYGLKIPETNYDDLAGLDLKGKIVVYLAGSTADTPTALSAHYQTLGERWKSSAASGRHWNDRYTQSGVDGHSVVPDVAQSCASFDGSGRRRVQRHARS